MKKYINTSKQQDDIISAIDLGDEFYYNPEGLKNYLDSLPSGTRIYDIVNAPGSYRAGSEVICEKSEGYKTVYYNPWGVSPADAKYNDTWWTISGSETDVFTLVKIITKGTKYYCTRDVFEDSNI